MFIREEVLPREKRRKKYFKTYLVLKTRNNIFTI